ncbi:hypothetical protein PE066_02915 [Ramlibacter tataouinensis]|uniref:hypothetical protein n=1 Tax=Ramlibacter tataouinensis TaxID=94132 RepID=UPI0022F3C492|nr:hypothetical protein [Ramlibacter tataouinensis]WBY02502.1 hypothetical protein PE066_02915 [Ramlibacter tataouinensis]
MSNTTPTGDDGAGREALNPALHRSTDETYGKDFHGTDPMKSVSVQDTKEGDSWPAIWAIVAGICILVTLYLLVT